MQPHIPLSGRNPVLQEVLGIRPHLLVLNKMDLADPRQQSRVLEQLRQQGCSHVVFTDCQQDSNVKKIVPLVAKLVSSSPRYHRAESTEYSIMVIGVPNVVKATAVGGEPGVTKAVLTRIQVCETPLVYLVDTPGVLPPKLADVETGMKLALCGAIRDHLVGEDIMADYLLYVLNQQQQFGYVERYGLPEASDNIRHVLKYVAVTLGKTQKVKVLTGTGNVSGVTDSISPSEYACPQQAKEQFFSHFLIFFFVCVCVSIKQPLQQGLFLAYTGSCSVAPGECCHLFLLSEAHNTAHLLPVSHKDKTLQTQQTVSLILPLVKQIPWAVLWAALPAA
uniref:Uncharacterized protein n=1 Tax=Meleagris gallopavo TaxID=9103 RepID=G1MSM7_MELGA